MDKSDLRREAMAVLSALTLDGDEGDRAAARFMTALPIKAGDVIALYAPIKRELDTYPLAESLRRRGAQVALPVFSAASHDETPLTFSLWPEQMPLISGPFGILVPSDIHPIQPCHIVLPLLAFDRKGTRLGRGGGHYDRTLASLRKGGYKGLAIGYGYAQQICLFPLPRESHDLRMDMVITPQDTHDFRA